IVEKLTNGYFAHKVARELVIYYRRDGVSLQENVFLQFRNHIHEGIHKAQDYIIEHIHIKHNNHELAQIACMSDRNFTRTFKLETGITVNDFITNIRIEKLKTLIQNPDLSRKQIATQIGLESEKQVARLLKSDLAENVRYLSPD
ncbi:MAG: helix-turn-helix domain-containing protein, partial [Chitinophagales bacterium]